MDSLGAKFFAKGTNDHLPRRDFFFLERSWAPQRFPSGLHAEERIRRRFELVLCDSFAWKSAVTLQPRT
jgi:hypothetical protein